jgi:hypothetical protein
MRRRLLPHLCLTALAAGITVIADQQVAPASPSPIGGRASADVLFRESFDDDRLVARGWYDNNRITISRTQPFAGDGSIEYAWPSGATTSATSTGMRRLFTPSDSIYLSVYLRLSRGWAWTGRAYHPHFMHFLTTENDRFAGPAATHLTVYIEAWNGHLRLAAQDIQNHDSPHGLTQGPLLGGYNAKTYDSAGIVFDDDRWHHVEAFFKLNSLDRRGDRPNTDGVVRGWVDGQQVVDRTDVILRSADFPNMKFNQFLLTPYFGPGLLPHAQTLWVDELIVATERP